MSGLIINAWPGLSQFKKADWDQVSLSEDEVNVAIDRYKRYKYLREIGYYQHMFPLSSVETSNEQYVWLIIERLDYIFFGAICFYLRPNKEIIKSYLLIKFFDLIDHLIHYNEQYFKAGPFPITYNVVSIVIFTTYVAHLHISRNHGIPEL